MPHLFAGQEKCVPRKMAALRDWASRPAFPEIPGEICSEI